jgi:3-hydroxyacyl-[acyl-carrier-protein] dehydratase
MSEEKMTKESGLYDVRKIATILPHRYPFLLVDRIIHLDVEKGEIIGQKNVTFNEHFFQGHFPSIPIMPGVLVLEALAQTGGVLVHEKGYGKKIALLMNVSFAKFRRPIIPGDVIALHAKALHVSNKGGKIEAKAVVNDKVAVEAELSFALLDKEQL